MADSYRPKITGLVLLAGALSLVVTALRVVGEMQGWDARWFGADAGSPLNPLGIVWLVPVFGFLFGRRLAQAHGRPPFVAGFFVPMFGFVSMLAAGGYIGANYKGEALREAMQWLMLGSPVAALLALFAWPRAFVTMLAYGVLARLPVVVVQYLDIQNGWQTHYGKVHASLPHMDADQRLHALTMAQAGFWLPFTILLGCGCAALGATTVKKG